MPTSPVPKRPLFPWLSPEMGGGTSVGSLSFVRHMAPPPCPVKAHRLCSLPVLGTQEMGEQAVLPEEISSGNAQASGEPRSDAGHKPGGRATACGARGLGSREQASPALTSPSSPGAQPRASLRLVYTPGQDSLSCRDQTSWNQPSMGLWPGPRAGQSLSAFSPICPPRTDAWPSRRCRLTNPVLICWFQKGSIRFRL